MLSVPPREGSSPEITILRGSSDLVHWTGLRYNYINLKKAENNLTL